MCFWFKIVRLVAVAAVALCAGIAPAATTISASSSAEFRLDTREGPRESDGSETLTYSSLWDGGTSSDVAIAQACGTPHTTNGTLVAGLSGEDVWNWTAQYDGVYTRVFDEYGLLLKDAVDNDYIGYQATEYPDGYYFVIEPATEPGKPGKTPDITRDQW